MKITLKDATEFRKILLEKGYSQRTFSEAIEIAAPYFNLIINEERNPSGKVAKKIVGELNLEFNDIFFITDACKSKQC